MSGPRGALRRTASRVKGVAMDVGAIPYAPIRSTGGEVWDQEYATGQLQYYNDLRESARYGVLLGYLRALGGMPSVLDVGCGNGILRQRLQGTTFSHYLGIDVSAAAIEQAQRWADDTTTFAVAEGVAGLGPFDVIICNEMLYYLDSPEGLLEEIGQALAPRGHLLTSIWHHRGSRALRRMIDRRFEVVDAVDVRNTVLTERRWHLACHRQR